MNAYYASRAHLIDKSKNHAMRFHSFRSTIVLSRMFGNETTFFKLLKLTVPAQNLDFCGVILLATLRARKY